MKHKKLRALCEGAIMVALAQVLGYLKISPLPNGGSISFVMLPIFIYCVRWGLGCGLIASFSLGTLQFLLDGGFSIGWQSIIGDYVLAYGVLGIAGLFRRQKFGFFCGTLVGSLARFAVAWVVGATLWAEYMPEEFFGMSMSSPWLYSALYNGSYILLCAALCIAVGAIFYKPLGRFLRGEDL
ncbi:MAG: proton-coupled thiamine transporter YuaJ [Ruminococcaceae bacterium]|nr:proton-coupled thiamine transporter YuaJ [Oscillospiraceae bacterium]